MIKMKKVIGKIAKIVVDNKIKSMPIDESVDAIEAVAGVLTKAACANMKTVAGVVRENSDIITEIALSVKSLKKKVDSADFSEALKHVENPPEEFTKAFDLWKNWSKTV